MPEMYRLNINICRYTENFLSRSKERRWLHMFNAGRRKLMSDLGFICLGFFKLASVEINVRRNF